MCWTVLWLLGCIRGEPQSFSRELRTEAEQLAWSWTFGVDLSLGTVPVSVVQPGRGLPIRVYGGFVVNCCPRCFFVVNQI